MIKSVLLLLTLIASFILGNATDKDLLAMLKLRTQAEPHAYLVVGWQINAPDKLEPFGEAVVPLANQAGFKMLAINDAHLLEGEWPYSGTLIVQQYDSMAALKAFWQSPEHREVIKLREDYIDSHFVVAVEGYR